MPKSTLFRNQSNFVTRIVYNLIHAILFLLMSIMGHVAFADDFSDTLRILENEAQVQELYFQSNAWFYYEKYNQLPVSNEGTQWARQISFAQQSSTFWHLVRFEILGLLEQYERIGKPVYRIEAVQKVVRNLIVQLMIAGRKAAHDLQIGVSLCKEKNDPNLQLFERALKDLNQVVSVRKEHESLVSEMLLASERQGFAENHFDLLEFYEEAHSFRVFVNALLPFIPRGFEGIQRGSWADTLSNASNDLLIHRSEFCNLLMQYRKGLSFEELSFGGPRAEQAIEQIKSEITTKDLLEIKQFNERAFPIKIKEKKETLQGSHDTLSLESSIKFDVEKFKTLVSNTSKKIDTKQLIAQLLSLGAKRSNNRFGKRLFLEHLDGNHRTYFKLNSRILSSPEVIRRLLVSVLLRSIPDDSHLKPLILELGAKNKQDNEKLSQILRILEAEGSIILPSGTEEISKVAVSQLLFFLVLENNPSSFKYKEHCPNEHQVIEGHLICPNHPAENIRWVSNGKQNSVQEFLSGLNVMLKAAHLNYGYRLPTLREYQWAAELNDSEKLDRTKFITFWSEDQPQKTHQLKAKLPNHKGFYNSGVMEWTDETPPNAGGSHLMSCGAFSLIEAAYNSPPLLKPDYSDSDTGLRLVKFYYSSN